MSHVKKINSLIAGVLWGLIFCSRGLVFPQEMARGEPVIFEADYAIYDQKRKVFHAEGEIFIKQADLEIQCERVDYNMQANQIIVPGEITLREGNIIIRGKRGDYDFTLKSGLISEASFSALPWYGSAEEIEKNAKGYICKDAWLATCALKVPHYRLVSRRMSFYPEEKFTSSNMFFVIGKVPVFYFPYYWRSLKSRKHGLHFQVGRNVREGEFLKIIWRYPITAEMSANVYLDYFRKKGLGGGLGYRYSFPNLYGDLYSYWIEEKDIQKSRYSIKYKHSQQFPHNFTLKANLDFTSDKSFNYDYRRDYWMPRTARRKSYLALGKKSSFYTLTVSGQRWDKWDEGEGRFISEAGYTWAPKVDFAFLPYRIGQTPLYCKFSEKLVNYYAGEKEQYRIDNDSDLSLFARVNVFKWLTLSPKVSFANRFEVENNFSHATSTTCYLTALNTSLRAGRFSRLQIDYRYGKTWGGELERNKMNISLQNIFPKARIRFSTGYDFEKKNRNLEENFDNLVGEATLGKFFNTTFYFRDTYEIRALANRSLESRFEFSPADEFSLSGGLSYFSGGAGQLDVNGGIGFRPTRHWRLQIDTRYDLKEGKFKEQRLNLYRDLHCWEAGFVFRKTPLEEEFWFRLNIKAFPERKYGVYHHLQREEWNFLGPGQ